MFVLLLLSVQWCPLVPFRNGDDDNDGDYDNDDADDSDGADLP